MAEIPIRTESNPFNAATTSESPNRPITGIEVTFDYPMTMKEADGTTRATPTEERREHVRKCREAFTNALAASGITAVDGVMSSRFRRGPHFANDQQTDGGTHFTEVKDDDADENAVQGTAVKQ
jgi:hypothetical protein